MQRPHIKIFTRPSFRLSDLNATKFTQFLQFAAHCSGHFSVLRLRLAVELGILRPISDFFVK